MDVHKILTDCDTLENTISILIKDNSTKESELTSLQRDIFERTKNYLESTLDREVELQKKLDETVSKRQSIEDEIKQYASVNEKLSELVSIAQKRSSQQVNNDTVAILIEAYEDYSQLKSGFIKTFKKARDTEEGLSLDCKEVDALIRKNTEILVDLHKNDNLIRLLEQQNKYAEQEFDLILNQLPWEPLTKDYLEELKLSANRAVKDLAGTLQVQASEIEELNESLNFKKKKKLEALEGLLSELTSFIQKRDQAVVMAKLTE